MEIIAASYRTLMTKMRSHPDLGGDPEQAVMLNQAYAVLSDPVLRLKYDLSLKMQSSQPAGSAGRAAGSAGTGAAAGQGRHSTRPAVCLFCQATLPSVIEKDTRCRCCDSPLAPVTARALGKHELIGRRRAPRTAKADVVSVHTGWQAPASPGRLRDLSMTGLSVLIDRRVEPGQVIRVVAPSIDMLVTVVACRASGRAHIVHASLQTVVFTQQRGVFVSTQA